jgi:hypothetical protein
VIELEFGIFVTIGEMGKRRLSGRCLVGADLINNSQSVNDRPHLI